jgi:hypothetical protein
MGFAEKMSGRKQTRSASVDMTNLGKKFSQLENRAKSALADVTNELAKIGEDTMKGIIRSSESNFGRVRMRYNIGRSAGRNDTGSMLNSVKANQVNRSGKIIRTSFGWPKNSPDYFWYQDNGFRNVLEVTGFNAALGIFTVARRQHPIWQTGIFSLRDARKEVVANLPRVKKKAERKIAQL